jgi:hypothetical protein
MHKYLKNGNVLLNRLYLRYCRHFVHKYIFIILKTAGISVPSVQHNSPNQSLMLDILVLPSFLFFFLSSFSSSSCTGVWTQGLGRHSTTWATPPALFALVTLELGSCILPRHTWTTILLFYASSHCWDNRPVPSLFSFFFFHWYGFSLFFFF